MKTFLTLITFMGLQAQAGDITTCTQALNFMTDDINKYVEIIKSCQSIKDKKSRLYLQYQKVARSYEAHHQKAASLCYKTCDATSFCEGQLDGACP